MGAADEDRVSAGKNGSCPVSISYIKTAADHKSAAGPLIMHSSSGAAVDWSELADCKLQGQMQKHRRPWVAQALLLSLHPAGTCIDESCEHTSTHVDQLPRACITNALD